MKIIETRTTPNSRRVRIFLAEKGIEIPFDEVDMTRGGTRTAEFTRGNPLRRVPALVLDDGTWICESVAICRYFEEVQPDPALFGRGPKGRGEVEMWQRRVELGLFFHVGQAFRHLHPSMATFEVPQIAEWGLSNKPKAEDALRFLDSRLAQSRFIAGSDYSIADITALVAVDFMKPARIRRPDPLPNIDRWYGEVASRPSAGA